MHNYEYGNHNVDNHVNAFVDLNGVPYLLAEYLDRDTFQQIDRSQIKSEILVDQSDAMRAVFDISIDDIGKRASDGYPSIIGNNSKQRNLLKMVSDNREIMDHQFNVLRRGIVIRVDYQLENHRTRQVIRSMSETFRILDRNYFLDINPRNVNDNAIIVNFCNTMVSTINEFTHGRDPMMFRVTNIHMSYEMVKPSPKMPRIKQSMSYCDQRYDRPGMYGMENDIYGYHKMMQNRHIMSGYDDMDYGNEDISMISPSSWSMFNRFYHFDNGGRDIVIHGQEVNDTMTKVVLIPCGTVRVNRTFMINPGHRIIFKFSIWKNDLTVVSDTTRIAQGLRAPILDNPGYGNNHNIDNPCEIHCDDNHHHGHIIDPDYETVIRMLHDSRTMDRRQNQVINELSETVSKLSDMIQNMIPSTPETPEIPEDSDTGIENPEGESCCDNCDDEHDRLEDKIDEVDNDVANLQVAVDAIPDVIAITTETIKDIVSANSQPSET